MLMRGAFLEDPPGFVPVPRIVIAYTIPFFFGWLLYRNRDLLDTFRSRAKTHVVLALALLAAWMVFVAPVQNRPESGSGLSLCGRWRVRSSYGFLSSA